jgi:hypothetical protein
MVRQRWLGSGTVLGLMVLAAAVPVDEATVATVVEKLGGRDTVDAKRSGKPVVAVDFINSWVTDAGLKRLKEFKSLQTLALSGIPVTDAGLKELKDAERAAKRKESGCCP